MSSKGHVAGYAGLAFVLTVLVGIAAYVACALVFLMCDGDGGSPYAASLSARGQACNGGALLVTALACLAAVSQSPSWAARGEPTCGGCAGRCSERSPASSWRERRSA